MRLKLNLATHPYQDVRAFYMKWAAILGGTALLTVVLVWAAVGGWMRTRDMNRQINQKRDEIARLQQEEKAAQAILDQEKNRGVREDSAFLNELIARKSFSWTLAFSELEKLMPTRVHVTSMHPQIDAEKQLEIRMTVTGDSREKALELLRRMEDSPHFRQPQLLSEIQDPKGGPDIQFIVSAYYVPSVQVAGGAP